MSLANLNSFFAALVSQYTVIILLKRANPLIHDQIHDNILGT